MIGCHIRKRSLPVGLGLMLCLPATGNVLAGTGFALADAPPAQREEYLAERPKSILELQAFRHSETRDISGPDGQRRGQATLLNLNPHTNAWLLLTLNWDGKGQAERYHLENPHPQSQVVRLSEDPSTGLVIEQKGRRQRCDLWAGTTGGALEQGRRSGLPYAPLCDGRLLLRNKTAGSRTHLEKVTDLLRDHIWGGEQIVGFVRETFYRDAYLDQGRPATPAACASPGPDAPAAASLDPAHRGQTAAPESLGIPVETPGPGLALGCWYPVSGQPGIYLSALKPKVIAQDMLDSHRGRVSALDAVEASALSYLVAFDLDAFDVGFELGTDHPRLDWSGRAGAAVRNNRLPGPDGVKDSAPLVTTGMVSPVRVGQTAAAFTGGFKRTHSAFRYGELSQRNHGSHYGFLSNGVLFSKLLPELATLYVLDDGRVDIKTWTDGDNRLLGRLRHARQNGVPLIRDGVPGELVARWGPGNWSGSAEGKLRTLRAGACIQEHAGRRFLIYGYFSTATPSAMARVFQAYGCRNAMLLDMNALEHTYLALYSRNDGQMKVQHLINGMTEVDKRIGNRLVPRFIGFPDNRDFFYLTRRENKR